MALGGDGVSYSLMPDSEADVFTELVLLDDPSLPSQLEAKGGFGAKTKVTLSCSLTQDLKRCYDVRVASVQLASVGDGAQSQAALPSPPAQAKLVVAVLAG